LRLKKLISESHSNLINSMISNRVNINHQLKSFNKVLRIEGDKSLSIRWALLASQATGKSTSHNLLRSEDIKSTLNCLKKLGVRYRLLKNKCEIFGVGLNGFHFKKKKLY
jgi:3-phosphoshikimate 1-carboxyvinyltransferase